MFKIIIKGALIFTLTCHHVHAQNCIHKNASILIENDSTLTLGGGTDRFYSNGIDVLFRCQKNINSDDYKVNLAHRSLSWFTSDFDIFKVNNGFKLGQKILPIQIYPLDLTKLI